MFSLLKLPPGSSHCDPNPHISTSARDYSEQAEKDCHNQGLPEDRKSVINVDDQTGEITQTAIGKATTGVTSGTPVHPSGLPVDRNAALGECHKTLKLHIIEMLLYHTCT
ncbi:hypothetical protein HGM15179_001312 [Zosterops borbonicus]|uniref:Uncharacterized protein n=1 Tax=Zosterops borbonicus TaxID=364589 RepID=A0A8K1LTU0_9PASS|nr:hypothetical protein HGM15179_001312 [Zosterops borbonicus]